LPAAAVGAGALEATRCGCNVGAGAVAIDGVGVIGSGSVGSAGSGDARTGAGVATVGAVGTIKTGVEVREAVCAGRTSGRRPRCTIDAIVASRLLVCGVTCDERVDGAWNDSSPAAMGSELAKTPAVASKQLARKPLNADRERTVIVVPPSNFTQSMRDGAAADESPLSANSRRQRSEFFADGPALELIVVPGNDVNERGRATGRGVPASLVSGGRGLKFSQIEEGNSGITEK